MQLVSFNSTILGKKLGAENTGMDQYGPWSLGA